MKGTAVIENKTMGLLKSQRSYTAEEYLAMERKSKRRHQYLDGDIFAMAGESWNHAVISSNVARSLGNQLENKPCHTVSKDTKVRSGPFLRGANKSSGLFSYPDIVIVCDEPEFYDDATDVVLNPKVIVEVLSPATEKFDRGEKFHRYQTYNPTLTDYLLVSQDKAQIEQYTRKSNGTWSYEIHSGMNATINIRSIGCRVKMKDVYARIKFKPKKRLKPDSVFGEDEVD